MDTKYNAREITGHRPKFFPWGDDLTDKRAMLLLKDLQSEIII